MRPRTATADDAATIVRVVNRAYAPAEGWFVAGPRTSETDVRRRLEAPDAAFLVVDRVADALDAAVYVERRGARGYFGLLAVDPDAQGRGLGRRLVATAEAWCREAGCLFLDLSVVSLRAELPAFYAALGFAAYDTAPFPEPALLKRPAHMVLMTKPLVSPWGE